MSAPPDLVAHWWVGEAASFDARFWPEGAVVYVPATGQTHALGAAAAAVLMRMCQIGERPASVDNWLSWLDDGDEDPRSDAAPVSGAENDAELLSQIFSELHRIGVLQRSL